MTIGTSNSPGQSNYVIENELRTYSKLKGCLVLCLVLSVNLSIIDLIDHRRQVVNPLVY